ncbi:MAG: acyltransferase [Actinomycetota bacterium]
MHRLKAALARFHRRIHDFEDRRDAPRFSSVGPGSLVRAPGLFVNPERISIGRDSTIHPYCRIEVITQNPHLHGPEIANQDARIEIGDRVVINAFTHIGAMSLIRLGDDVGIASGVCIEDHQYEYHQATDDKPLKQQGFRIAPVIIEDGVMIGEHVTVLPGVRIGRNSWIGANSVVTKDVPPYSIAVGVPAKVIRQRDAATGGWNRTG